MQCGDFCKQEPECKGYNWWDHEYCELKSTNDGLVASAIGYSGFVVSKAESLKQCAPITDNLDFPGNDVMTSVVTSVDDYTATSGRRATRSRGPSTTAARAT